MGEKLSNAPVFYTVAQVQCNAVLDLETYITVIQARMREAKFPDYRKEIVQTMGFSGGDMSFPAGMPQVGQQQARYRFGDISGYSSFVIDANSLSFQTTRYDTFEIFSEIFLKGLSIFNAIVKLDFIERIGLRYLDAVLPKKESEESLENMLAPQLLGFSMSGLGALKHSVCETVVETDVGQLVSRVIIRHGKVGLPMELGGPYAPKVERRFTEHEGLHAIIDTDAIAQHREEFDIDKVESRLAALHTEIVNCFEAAITKSARDSWA